MQNTSFGQCAMKLSYFSWSSTNIQTKLWSNGRILVFNFMTRDTRKIAWLNIIAYRIEENESNSQSVVLKLHWNESSWV
jgi:hypothetical protein